MECQITHHVETDIMVKIDTEVTGDTVSINELTDAVETTADTDPTDESTAAVETTADTDPTDESTAAVETTTDTDPTDESTAAVEASHTFDAMVPVGTLLSRNTIGSGDAPESALITPTITIKDIQDMILPDPSIVNLLSSFIQGEQPPDNPSTNDLYAPISSKPKDNHVSKKNEDQGNDDQTIRLSSKDIFEMRRFCNVNEEEGSGITFDLEKVEDLFRCETCQEMPISSETVHTCDFGHQVCGWCYSSGIRTCYICKGHLCCNNEPLENVLRRLRQNYPDMFNPSTSSASEGTDIDCISRFFSLKPLECPEDGCKSQCSARSLRTHFRTEHKHVPSVDVSLFKPCNLVLPKRLLGNVNGNVIAVVNLKITDEEIASELFTDTLTCWVQSGAIDVDKEIALAVWVSCAYEESLMPPVLYNVRLSTADGYSSFGGEMTPLHDYNGPKSVLADGKCLVIFPKYLQDATSVNKGNLNIELKFYPH